MIDVSQNYTVGLPVAASTYAKRIDFSLNILQAGMIAIFVLWGLFFAYCLFRFRKSKTPAATHKSPVGDVTSFVPDAMVLAFEIWLIFFLGLPLWSQVKEEF